MLLLFPCGQLSPIYFIPLVLNRNVQNMADIKTHLGYARAWVRLCLEKKLLYVHLTTLLSEESLLRFFIYCICRLLLTDYREYVFLLFFVVDIFKDFI